MTMTATRAGAAARAVLARPSWWRAGRRVRQPGAGRSVGRSAGGGAPDRRRQPGPGAHQRHRIAGGRRTGLRPAGPLLGRPPRARARSGDQLDGQLRRHHLDLRAAAQSVRFHDGTPFDADAVVFSFERQIVPEHPAHEADFVWTRAYHNIRRVRAAGPLRVQFEIDRPYAPFLANLAMGPAAIVSPTAVRKWKRDFGRHPVGTGPVPLRRVDPGRPHHAGAQPRLLGRTRAHPLPRAARDARLAPAAAGAGVGRRRRHPAAGARRSAAGPPATPISRLAMAPATLVSYLAMNTQRRPLNDPRIRRAIAHAVEPRRAGQARVPGARASRRSARCRPTCGAPARTSSPTRTIRPRARKLLAEAGWQGDRESPLKLFAPSAASQYMPAPARVAGIIKRCLGEVGIAVDVILSEPADHQRALWAGEHDLALHGWFNDNGDPDNFLYTLLDSDNTTGSRPSNIAFYSNAWFHDVIGMAQRHRSEDPTRAPNASGCIRRRRRSWRSTCRGCRWRTRRSCSRSARRCAGWWCSRRRWVSIAGRSTRHEPVVARRDRAAAAAVAAIRSARAAGASAAAGRLQAGVVVERQHARVQHLPRRGVAGARRQRLVAAGQRGDAAARPAAAAVRRAHHRGARPGHRRVGRRGRADLLQRRAGHRVRGRARPAGRARAVPAAGAAARRARGGRWATTRRCCARRRRRRSPRASGWASCRRGADALFETTDATGRVIARCTPRIVRGGARRRRRAGGAARRSFAGHPARARLRTHGQRRAVARSAGRARRAAAGRSRDAAARRRDRDRGDRRLGRRSLEGGAGRRPRGGGLRGRRPQRVDVHGRDRRAAGRSAAAARLQGGAGRARGRRSSRSRSTATRIRSRSGSCRTSTPRQVGLLGRRRRSRAAGRRAPAREHDAGAGRDVGAAAGDRAVEPAGAAHDAAAAEPARGRAGGRARRSGHQLRRRHRRRDRRRRRGVPDHDAQLARESGGAGGARARAGHRPPGRARGQQRRRSRPGVARGHHRDPERARRQDRRDRAGGRGPRGRARRRSWCARSRAIALGERLAPLAGAVAAPRAARAARPPSRPIRS